MTVKTTLSFTDRHHQFLSEKVGQGVFATQSAAVAAAQSRLSRDTVFADNPVASGPRRTFRAAPISPLETPLRYNHGKAASNVLVLRT